MMHEPLSARKLEVSQRHLMRLLGTCAGLLSGEMRQRPDGTLVLPEDQLRENCDALCREIGFKDLRDLTSQALELTAQQQSGSEG